MSDLMRWGRDPSDGWLYPEPTGYWTPWDTANAEITRLRAEVAELRQELDELTAENRLREERCRLYHNTVEAAQSIINSLRAQLDASLPGEEPKKTPG